MKNKILLFLDDLRDPEEDQWKKWLEQYSPIEQPYKIIWVKSYDEFKEFIDLHVFPDAICWDHDLGGIMKKELVAKGMSKRKAKIVRQEMNLPTGYDCAKYLVELCLDHNLPLPKYAIQSANPVGKENIDMLLKNYNKHYYGTKI